MPTIYTVEIDGKTYDLEGDHPPSEAEARAAVGPASTQQSTPPPGAASAGMMAPSTMDGDPDTSNAGIGNPGIRQMMQGMDTRSGELRSETAEHPVRTAGTLALGALPAAGPLAAKIPGVVGGVMAKHSNAVSSIAGAVPGILSGDLKNAAFGAILGNNVSRSVAKIGKRLRGPVAPTPKPPSSMVTRMDNRAQPPAPTRPPPFTGVRNLEDIAIEANRRMRVARLAKEAQQGSAATQPVTPAAAMEREVMAREPGGPINWRTTDAVPIDARKARGIIEPGESQIGLGERIAELLKAGTPEAMSEATQLAKALRQRGHVRMERAGS